MPNSAWETHFERFVTESQVARSCHSMPPSSHCHRAFALAPSFHAATTTPPLDHHHDFRRCSLKRCVTKMNATEQLQWLSKRWVCTLKAVFAIEPSGRRNFLACLAALNKDGTSFDRNLCDKWTRPCRTVSVYVLYRYS